MKHSIQRYKALFILLGLALFLLLQQGQAQQLFLVNVDSVFRYSVIHTHQQTYFDSIYQHYFQQLSSEVDSLQKDYAQLTLYAQRCCSCDRSILNEEMEALAVWQNDLALAEERLASIEGLIKEAYKDFTRKMITDWFAGQKTGASLLIDGSDSILYYHSVHGNQIITEEIIKEIDPKMIAVAGGTDLKAVLSEKIGAFMAKDPPLRFRISRLRL